LIPYLQLPGVYLCEKSNGGTASALNAGIRIAARDYIAWLSSDDRFYPGKLEKQLDYMLPRNGKISFSDMTLSTAAARLSAGTLPPNIRMYLRSTRHSSIIARSIAARW
jgi:teichuronic acid biosynthesis glycosyltransferase TuaG